MHTHTSEFLDVKTMPSMKNTLVCISHRIGASEENTGEPEDIKQNLSKMKHKEWKDWGWEETNILLMNCGTSSNYHMCNWSQKKVTWGGVR